MTPVILPASLQEAQRPIAGIAAISRILIELSRSGARRAVVAIEPRFSLIARADEELARAGQSLKVSWIAPGRLAEALGEEPDTDFVGLGCEVLLKAPLLARLAAAPQAALVRAGGQVVAARLGAAVLAADGRAALRAAMGEPLPAAASDVVGLEHPVRAAEAVLRDTGKASDGWVSRRLNRPVSRRISARLLGVAGLRPGHLTLATAVVAAVMFTLLALGGRAGLVLGCVLFHVASVIDGLDGEVARATFRSSAGGALADTAVDVATNLLFVLGLSIGLAAIHAHAAAEAGALGLLLWGAGVLCLAVLIRLGPRGGSLDVLKIAYGQRMTGRLGALSVAVSRNILGRDFFALAFAVLGLFGLYWAIPWMVAVAAGVWLVLIAAAAPMLLRSRPGGLQPEHLAPVGAVLEPRPAVEP